MEPIDLTLYINLDQINKVVFGVNIEGIVTDDVSATLKLNLIDSEGAFSIDGVFTTTGEIEFLVPRIDHLFSEGSGEYEMTFSLGNTMYEPFKGVVMYYRDDVDEIEDEEEEIEYDCDDYDDDEYDVWEELARTPEHMIVEKYKELVLGGLDVPIVKELVLEEIEIAQAKKKDKDAQNQ